MSCFFYSHEPVLQQGPLHLGVQVLLSHDQHHAGRDLPLLWELLQRTSPPGLAVRGFDNQPVPGGRQHLWHQERPQQPGRQLVRSGLESVQPAHLGTLGSIGNGIAEIEDCGSKMLRFSVWDYCLACPIRSGDCPICKFKDISSCLEYYCRNKISWYKTSMQKMFTILITWPGLKSIQHPNLLAVLCFQYLISETKYLAHQVRRVPGMLS